MYEILDLIFYYCMAVFAIVFIVSFVIVFVSFVILFLKDLYSEYSDKGII